MLSKYNCLSWDNLIIYLDIIIAYKVLHGLPPPLKDVDQLQSNTTTRAASKRDCKIFRKSSFGQSAFSTQASHSWNTFPLELRNITSLIVLENSGSEKIKTAFVF